MPGSESGVSAAQLQLCARSKICERLDRTPITGETLPSTILQAQSPARTLCDILQWIALCFSLDSASNINVAASITFAKGMVTVHLSDDVGSTKTQHYEAVEADLLRHTKVALDNRKKIDKSMPKYNVEPNLSQFEAMSIRFHWAKILQASKEVGEVIPHQSGKGTRERFNELLNLWVHRRTGKHQTAPTHPAS